MFKTDLTTILKSFDKVQAKLAKHVDAKLEERFVLHAEKSYIEDELIANAQELDRASRVLSRVQELVA